MMAAMLACCLRLILIVVAVAPLALAAGCPSPDLGQAPFFCNAGDPPCPDGYDCRAGQTRACLKNGSPRPPSYPAPRFDLAGRCKAGAAPCPTGHTCVTLPAKVCVAEGAPLPGIDGGASDRGPGKDGPVVPKDGPGPGKDGPVVPRDGPKPPPDTTPGKDQPQQPVVKVIVTELMADPDEVWDSYGEWIELFNPTSGPININGWTLRDNGQDKHVIAHTGPLNVPAKGYLVLGMHTNMVLNGGVKVAYAYKNFFLSNNEDEVYLINAKGQTVDSFHYSKAAGFTIPTGGSLSVVAPGADKNKPESWCEEPKAWPGSAGDKGTPLGNPNCP